MADKFTFTAAQRTELRKELGQTLLQTELSGNTTKQYQLSNAKIGQSGYSFGLVQYDLGTTDKPKPGSDVFLKSIGISEGDLSALRAAANAKEHLHNSRLNPDDVKKPETLNAHETNQSLSQRL